MVHISRCHLTTHAQGAVFLDLSRLHAARDHGQVVCALDRHRHILQSRRTLVVRHRHGEGLGVRLASFQVLMRGVGHVVGPFTSLSIHHKRTVCACGIACVGSCRIVVHISRCHLTTHAQGAVFNDNTRLRIARD